MSAAAPGECDVAIVGGGLVGASLALALSNLPLAVVVIEAVPPDTLSQPSFDARTTALSNGTRRILTGLGVWDEIARAATPIRRIHVSERGQFGCSVLDAAEQGIPALGYVVENRAIGAALWRELSRASRVRLMSPAEVTAVSTDPERIRLEIDSAGEPRSLTARLVVAADGAGSIVRRAAGVAAERWDYGQTAVITTVAPERFHAQVAYERFTPAGPIAVLPIAAGRCGIIWTLAPDDAARALALEPAAFLAGLQQSFGWRLGRLTALGARHAYPLALTRAEAQSGPRVAIIGNASQGLHPIAGQGFNLGLRDAATLAEVLAEAAPAADPGDSALLARYVDWRRADRRAVIAFTDGLVRLFGSPFAPIRAARGLGLLLFDVSPAAKTALSRLSLGFAGRLPRLARGLPLIVPGRLAGARAP
ncbi:MAG TPA: 2-octaprenyl-6-methoxyphenyl hydroxylase [Steroidobacteraceae bacterium]|nr:2-octaprenyl-6-methoxyphenyl hydroxylase [Steroidobacteraceae bacterium]